jgi:hypothetical protein
MSVYSTVFAEDVKDVSISSVGTVSVPSYIYVSEIDMNGLKAVNLVANDNNLFRTTIVFGVPFSMSTSPNIDLTNADPVPMLESFMNSFSASSRGTILRTNPIKKLDLGTKKIVTTDRTILARGVAYGVNAYVTKNENAFVIVVFMSPDGDSSYWEPLRSKILATAK